MVGSRIYIGGLPYGTNERDLERFFRSYGRMREVTIKSGYGFVEFDDYRDAEDAVYELNGKRLLGERVTVERARGTPRGRDRWGNDSGGSSRGRDRERTGGRDRYGPPTRTGHRVIIENLSSRVSWQDLKDYMRQAGEVTYADAHRERKNEGVVEFASRSDMKNAVEKLDDTDLNGRRIRVVEDKSGGRKRRDSRSSSRSRSRSRSGRRSRSASKSKSRSKSRSKSKDDKASRSRSRSAKRSRSRSASRDAKKAREDHSKSRSKSRSQSKDKERDERSKSKENGRENRSKSREDRSRSRSKENGHRSRSGSRERSRSREASKEPSRSKSRSRSKSN